MSNGWIVRWLAVCVASGISVAACSRDACFPESMGHDYRVRVVERWDSKSRFPGGYGSIGCPTGLDMQPDDSLVVHINDVKGYGDGCYCGTGPVVRAPDGWTLTPRDSGGRCGADFYDLLVDVVSPTCSGDGGVSIRASKVPTGPAEPGKTPKASMDWYFQPEAAPYDNCFDSYVVEIESL